MAGTSKTGPIRLEIHVRPGASKTAVGGTYDDSLVVRVSEPADRGRATTAALEALADALGVPRRSVTLVRGATTRRKLVDVDLGADEHLGKAVHQRAQNLRKGGGAKG